MKPIELKKFGLYELSDSALLEINGGSTPPTTSSFGRFFRGLSWGFLAKEVIDHWAEIKKGLKEGWDVEHHH